MAEAGTFQEVLRAELLKAHEESNQVQEVVPVVAPPLQTKMEAGPLGGLAAIDDKLPFPLVQVGIGGLAGLLVGEMLDGFAAPKQGGKVNIANVISKGIAVMAVVGPGRRWLGTTGAMAFGTVLTVQVLADVLPVSEWAANLKRMLPSGMPKAKAGLAQPFPVTPAGRDKIAGWFG